MATKFTTYWNRVIVATIFAALVAAVPVSAATLTSVNHTLTSEQVGVTANHELVITTPSGVAEGDTIEIQFDASFNTASIGEDDVDIDDGGGDLTTAPDCTGAEEASVVVAADEVEITICPGDGGAIAPASTIIIEVGTNATASGTGTNQITNPVSVGTYQIYIGGTFGDWGSAWVPIDSPGNIPVALQVGAGGGGGGGGDPGDTDPPNIFNVQVINITETTATVTWDTDESADSKVDYGLTDGYEIGTESDTSLVLFHSLDLTGLTPGTLYHFQVRSADLDGNEATDGDYTFTTLDSTPPVILDPTVVDITETSARVIWTTDEPATSVVDYGLDATYGTQVSDSSLVTDHSVILLGLDPGTTYHYKVGSEDAWGNYAESGDDTFTTLDDPPPANVVLTVTPGDEQNLLEWINPPDDDLAGIWIVYRTDTYPTDPTDGTLIYDGPGEIYLHTGLTNGVTYYYSVFAYDDVGQFSSGALGSGTPFGPEEPLEEEEEEEEDPGDGEGEEEEEPPGDGEVEEEEPVIEDGVPGEVLDNDVEFFVAKNKIQLSPVGDVVRMLVGKELRVQLLTDHITAPVERVELAFGDSLYLMNPPMQQDLASGNIFIAALTDEAYSADIITPTDSDAYPLSVTIFYTSGSLQSIDYTAQVVDFGYTFEIVEGEVERVSGATVTLYTNASGSFAVWDGSPYGELNPVTTPSDGTFAWYVPIGEYYVTAIKEGYTEEQTAVFYVTDNIVNPEIQMSLLPPPLEEIVEAVSEEPLAAIGMIVDNLEFALDQLRDAPAVETATEFAIPILLLFSLGNILLLAVLFNLLPLLQYFFTAPILFFWRRKRKGWGVVYNAISKMPVDLAIVRLFIVSGGDKGKLLQSRVTDKHGRYFFMADKGLYRIEVTKPGFLFPTEYLADVKDDGIFTDVYHGEPIKVTENEATIAANVPIDPLEDDPSQNPARVKLIRTFQTLQNAFASVGVVLAVVVAIIMPMILTVVVALIQIGVYLLIRRLVKARKPKGWGIVYDAKTKKPIDNVVVRIFEPKYNKLLETTVTDNSGRYTFLVGPNEYFTRYERAGYEPFIFKPIDYKDKKEAEEVTIDVHLEPQGGQENKKPKNQENK